MIGLIKKAPSVFELIKFLSVLYVWVNQSSADQGLLQWRRDLKIVLLIYYTRQFLLDNSVKFGCEIKCLVVSFLERIFFFKISCRLLVNVM